MEEQKTQIISSGVSIDNLKITPSPSGQEYCAFTYLLVKDPKTPCYGIIKVLCTGRTMEEVETRVTEMMDNGTLEKEIPFVKITKTGGYRYLIAGGQDDDPKEAYNLQTKEKIVEPRKMLAERRKQQMKDMNEQMEDLRKESQEERETNPDSYEVYKFYKVQLDMIDPYIKRAEAELKKLIETKKKSINNVQRVERQFGNYRLRYEKETRGEAADNAIESSTDSSKGKDEE